MRILFVGMANSIHLVRWINQLEEKRWELILFPVTRFSPHPDLRGVTYINSSDFPWKPSNRSLRYVHWALPYYAASYIGQLAQKLSSSSKTQSVYPSTYRVSALIRTIKVFKPDIIHSLEIQQAGYLVMEARRRFKGKFPTWIVTNWGSDIYLFGRLSQHRERIREVLENCDFYSCECERDIRLARDLGLRGRPLPVFPNAGGFDLAHCQSLRQPGPVSARRNIMLKGYQGWAGRALVGLRALERCADLLRTSNYQVTIYSANNPEVPIAAELFEQNTGVKVNVLMSATHDDMLRQYGDARVYIGLSISDAISTSLLAARVMGTFPIQSCTACTEEWIVDGQSGLIIPPDDVEVVEAAIRRALTDDALVDRAAEINWQVAQARLASTTIRPQVISYYEQVYHAMQENQNKKRRE
jgi:glycosyltransferase involved in cell wall biosynthesis